MIISLKLIKEFNLIVLMEFRNSPQTLYYYNGGLTVDVEEMAKKAAMKDLKAIAKKHDIKLGRCPTKLKIAKMIPKEELEALVNEG